jgi:hypothetical protein
MVEQAERLPETPDELRAVLAAIGATPADAAALVSGLDEAALAVASAGGQSCLAVLDALVAAGADLGVAAHDVLGHVPNGGATRPAAAPTGAGLQLQLRFLREHIVSTIDQQGAAVWWTPDPTGRPLVAHAVDLVARDRELLADLERAAAAASGVTRARR